jgi:hypothetical protein
LFYITEDGKVMSAEVKAGSAFEGIVPRQLFQTSIKLTGGRAYAVAPDSQRFLIITPVEGGNSTPLIVVLNWTADLKH